MDFSHPGGEDRLGKFQKWGYPEIIKVMDHGNTIDLGIPHSKKHQHIPSKLDEPVQHLCSFPVFNAKPRDPWASIDFNGVYTDRLFRSHPLVQGAAP